MAQHAVDDILRRVEVACGRRSAEQYIENGRVLNVYSGEVLTGAGVAVVDGRVAYIGPSRDMVGSETALIDAGGGVLVPGYIDPHAHFDNLLSIRRVAEAVVPLGTTTIVNDTLAIVARFGAAGLSYLLAAGEGLPLRTYCTIPISGWAPELEELGYFAGLSLTDAELEALLCDRRVVGTSEFLPWRRLLSGDSRLMSRLNAAERHGKVREGHNPGARADHLQAIMAAGVTSCHEAVTADDALERLRSGLYVILRHGPARYDLPALAPVVMREGVDRSRLMLTPDWLPPNELVRDGHMDHVISSAMEAGVPPVEAFRMATVNPARYFHVEDQVGAIAPGRYADILCLDDLTKPRPRWVMAAGQLVAEHGQPVQGWVSRSPEPLLPPYKAAIAHATPADFRVFAGSCTDALVPAIEIVDKTVTRRVDLRLPVRDGVVVCDSGSGVMKMAVPRPGGGFATGFLTGIGARLGAMSSSMASEPYSTLLVGSDDHDMALAYNRMLSCGGGVIAVQDGRVEVELPLPLGGFFTTAPATEVGALINAVNEWARRNGSSLDNLFLTHHFLTYVGVPFFRMTPWGIYDVKTQAFLPSVL